MRVVAVCLWMRSRRVATRRRASRVAIETNVKVDGGRTRARSHRIGPCAFDNLRGNMLLRWYPFVGRRPPRRLRYHCPKARSAPSSVFCNKIAIVIGPTPPGTGVM